MIGELKQARALIAGGWVGPDLEPWCRVRAPGRRLNEKWGQPGEPFVLTTDWYQTLEVDNKAIEAWSVLGALMAVGLSYAEFDVLEVAQPTPAGMQTWLRASERTTADVLEVFKKAIQRAKKGERRG
jgi:hypothetical protein